MAAGRVLPKLVLVENTNAAAFKTPGSQATKYTFRHTFRLLQTAPRGERLLQTAPRRDRGRLETVCNETSKDTPTCSKTCFSYVSDQTKTKGCPNSITAARSTNATSYRKPARFCTCLVGGYRLCAGLAVNGVSRRQSDHTSGRRTNKYRLWFYYKSYRGSLYLNAGFIPQDNALRFAVGLLPVYTLFSSVACKTIDGRLLLPNAQVLTTTITTATTA